MGWAADKLTVKRVKQEVQAIMYVDPEDGELKAALVCSVPVKSGGDDKESLAKAQLDTLAGLGVPADSALQRVSGTAFDGAYIQGKGGIMEPLKKLLGILRKATSSLACGTRRMHMSVESGMCSRTRPAASR